MKCWCGEPLAEGKRKVCSTTAPEPHDKDDRVKERTFSSYDEQFKR